MPPAAIIAGGTIAGAAIGASASSKASKAQQQAAQQASEAQLQAAREANATQLEMYYQSRSDTLPWIQAGTKALTNLMGGTTYTGTPPSKEAIYAQYGVTPGATETGQQDAAYQQQLSDYNTWAGTDLQAAGTWPAYYGYTMKYGTSGPPTAPATTGTNLGQAGTAEAEYQRQLAEFGKTAQTTPGIIEAGPGKFEESPYYQLGLSEQNRATDAALAARGLYGSGKALKDLQANAVTNMLYNRPQWLNEWATTQLNPNLAIAGLGQVSAGQSAGNAITTGSNIGQNLYGAGTYAGNNILTSGLAQAGGAINQSNIWSNAINQLAKQAGGYFGSQNSLAATNNSYAGAGTNPYSGGGWWDGYQWVG